MESKVLLDYRERRVMQLIKGIFDFEVVNLPVGDILIVSERGGVLIERKEARDFVQSMITNRLWEQVRRMLVPEVMGTKIIRRALVVHGDMERVLRDRRIGWNNVMGAFMDVQYNYRIPVFHAPSDESLREFLRIMVKRENLGKNDESPKELWVRPIPKKEMSDYDWKVYILSSMPFIGDKLARNLLDHFGSIERIARANVIELKKVPGIGDKKARRIHALFH